MFEIFVNSYHNYWIKTRRGERAPSSHILGEESEVSGKRGKRGKSILKRGNKAEKEEYHTGVRKLRNRLTMF